MLLIFEGYLVSINEISFSTEQEFFDFKTKFEMDKFTIIAPNLEFKKLLVNSLAMSSGSVPDELILRLSEFLILIVKKTNPSIQFLDKNLFKIYLNQELINLNISTSEQYLVERSIEYLSVYGPLLSHERYRVIFEEYLNEDDVFRNIYKDVYPIMKKIWDLILESSFLIRQWSLGWLYQNLDKIPIQNSNIVIFKPESLKRIEIDFFEELSHSANVFIVKNFKFSKEESIEKIYKKAELKEKNYIWHKVATPIDELEKLAKIISEKELIWSNVRLIIPRNRIEYVKSIEIFLNFYFKQTNKELIIDPKLNFHRVQVLLESILSKIKSQSNEPSYLNDIIIFQGHENKFKNFNEFSKHTKHLIEPKNLKFKISNTKENDNVNQKINEIKKSFKSTLNEEILFNVKDVFEKINYYNFFLILYNKLSTVIDSKNPSSEFLLDIDKWSVSNLLEWSGSMISQIPEIVELSFENWLTYLEDLTKIKLEQNLLLTDLPIQLLEDVEFNNDYIYFILGCTQQNYELSSFAYLSDLEIDKLKNDLGFNFESKEFSEQLYEEFLNLKINHLNPEIHFISPNFSLLSEKENDAKFLTLLKNNNLCKLDDEVLHGFLSYESSSSQILSDISLKMDSDEEIKRDYYSASSLQKYINCPYVYFCEYVLGLKIEEELDMQPNNMFKGNLIHKALELYLERTDVTDLDIEQFIFKEVSKKYNHWNDTKNLQSQLNGYAKKIKDYVIFDLENKFLEGRKTIYKELDIKCYFNVDNLKFSNYRLNSKDFKIVGKIDRIDVNEDKVYIFDYKLSKGKSLGDWKKDFLLQMPIYGLMFVDGVLLIQGELSQLSFIVINNQFKFKNGLSINHKDQKFNLGLTFNKSNSQPDFETLKLELNPFRSLIKETLQGIASSEFSPAPLKPEYCLKCDWKDSCHAKHLY